MIHDLITNLLIAFYRITNLQVGGFDLKESAQNTQSLILNSDAVDQIQMIAGYVSIILIIFMIILFINIGRLTKNRVNLVREINPPEPAPGRALTARWQEITRHIDSIREAEWKFAIIEADKLVDDMLRKSGFVGDTMGERLMAIEKGQLLTLDGLWEAHKIRNRLAHEPNYFLRHGEAKRAMNQYEATLKELEAV